MNDVSIDRVIPSLVQTLQDIYDATCKGAKIATDKNFHLPSLKDYLDILNGFLDLLLPNDISLCCITGRVHAKWYYSTYYLLVEPISGGDMYNISIVPNGLQEGLTTSNTSVTLNDLCIILLLHTLSNKVSINELNNNVDELTKVKNIVCKRPLVKASELPRP